MTLAALALVFLAAGLHATWNYAAKSAGGGLPFVCVSNLVSLTCYAPVVAIFVWLYHPSIPAEGWLVIAGSGVIKTTYSLLLQRAYRTGDFSLIYPLARGTGPLLSTTAAILIFGERPGPVALAGGAVIILSVFYLTGGPKLFHESRAHLRTAALFGIASGLCIATYTVWDQRAVSHLHLPPVIYDCGTSVVMALIVAPFAWRRRDEVAFEWRTHRWQAATVGVFGSIGYILILTAMSFTPVSYIAPAREVSIVLGAFFGARVLREADANRRITAAIGMAIGIIALALG
ncbi:MAG TPA: DMT family transporter [Candidatus Didemnitutus sp.]|nr:DMT family transporter [Candidatus Didemnitutus sp.]